MGSDISESEVAEDSILGFKNSYSRVGVRRDHKWQRRVQRLAEVIQERGQEWASRRMIENEFPIERLKRRFSVVCFSVGRLERCQCWIAEKLEIGLRVLLAFRHFDNMPRLRREHQVRRVVGSEKFEIDVVG